MIVVPTRMALLGCAHLQRPGVEALHQGAVHQRLPQRGVVATQPGCTLRYVAQVPRGKARGCFTERGGSRLCSVDCVDLPKLARLLPRLLRLQLLLLRLVLIPPLMVAVPMQGLQCCIANLQLCL